MKQCGLLKISLQWKMLQLKWQAVKDLFVHGWIVAPLRSLFPIFNQHSEVLQTWHDSNHSLFCGIKLTIAE